MREKLNGMAMALHLWGSTTFGSVKTEIWNLKKTLGRTQKYSKSCWPVKGGDEGPEQVDVILSSRGDYVATRV